MRIESDLEHWIRWHLYRKRKNSGRSGALREFHEYLRKLPAGSVCVDCGANLGNITYLMRRKGSRVIAFEPDPVAVKILKRRFTNDPGITIIEKAVGGANRKAMFYQRPDVAGDIKHTKGSSLIKKRAHLDVAVAEVDVIDLPEFIVSLGDPVALLKVDIEGAEAELLEALLHKGVHRSIGQIYVETHERFSPELARRIADIRRQIQVEKITNINLDWT
ncbi:FkbM family methyltransferase [Mesorhizobium sp. WSM2239]|uniref:FkbM family methyltransferase n=2 Tax=unclassified Mesorhizobium TaxID=325217 RepID=A0AAU8DC72_9HYPH